MLDLKDVKVGMKVKVLSKTWYGHDELSDYDNWLDSGRNRYENGAYVIKIERIDGKTTIVLDNDPNANVGNYFLLKDIDFFEKKEFTNKDLKDGMVLTCRDGRKLIYLNNSVSTITYLTENECFDASNAGLIRQWKEDLMFDKFGCVSGYDIMKVTYMGEVLFEREEKVYYTLEEAVNSGKRFKHKDSATFLSCLSTVIEEIECLYHNKEILEEMNKKVWEVQE